MGELGLRDVSWVLVCVMNKGEFFFFRWCCIGIFMHCLLMAIGLDRHVFRWVFYFASVHIFSFSQRLFPTLRLWVYGFRGEGCLTWCVVWYQPFTPNSSREWWDMTLEPLLVSDVWFSPMYGGEGIDGGVRNAPGVVCGWTGTERSLREYIGIVLHGKSDWHNKP